MEINLQMQVAEGTKARGNREGRIVAMVIMVVVWNDGEWWLVTEMVTPCHRTVCVLVTIYFVVGEALLAVAGHHRHAGFERVVDDGLRPAVL